MHQVIISPVREHSEKPDEVYRRIERLYPGPYLELFARKEREGWTTWGNELPPPAIDAGRHRPCSTEPHRWRSLISDDGIPDFLRRAAP